ncbi:hypothetical protein AJ78_03246 [Emergomyces pasteurianus Ep9510]|uniref:Aminoglycoside phosphotransferase domain-containing protein n=1 Tax=Emergomyces pasteurianus Ep9510 TaxID=1447872 RepID=A0A1J9PKK5_9EURO|nr:hypothetical protein AJ78_03246 [Emergomyces pasteurianus Ep9510]
MGSGFEEQLLSEYDSTTLTHHILESESSKVYSRVFFLSPNLIAKQFLCGEEIGMLDVLQLATLLGVRAPSIKRTIETAENVYVVMGKHHYKELLSQHHVPLVFTHQDLAPRNMIVDERCQLWLLDWDYSGWYPVYFEYASMQNFDVPSNWRWIDRFRWKLFSWITVGLFPKEHRALEQAKMRFTRYPLGRKNEVLQDGAPARAVHLRKPGM